MIVPRLDDLGKLLYDVTDMVINGEEEKLHRFTITLPDDLYQWLHQHATENHRSMSAQNAYFLKLFRDTVGAHSSGLRGPVPSMADEAWLSFKGSMKRAK